MESISPVDRYLDQIKLQKERQGVEIVTSIDDVIRRIVGERKLRVFLVLKGNHSTILDLDTDLENIGASVQSAESISHFPGIIIYDIRKMPPKESPELPDISIWDDEI